MSILIALIALVLVALVVFVISAPLRAGGVEHAPARADGGRAGEESLGERAISERAIIARDELESAREAKYREIRDAELDYRTGKLSREDYAVVDGELRAEAIEILNRLEGPPPQTGPAPGATAPPSAPADGANRPALDENRPGADERDAAADGGGGGAVDGAGG